MMTADTLSQKAMELATDKKLKLACALIESVESGDAPNPEAAWDIEIRERVSRYDNDDTKAIPASDVFQKLREIAPAI